MEPLVAHCIKATVDCISEEVLVIDRELPEGSSRCCESSPRPRQTQLGQRSRQVAATVE